MSNFRRLLLLALLASSSAQASAGEFEMLDSNDDERVSSGEYEVWVRAVYDRMDTNADDKMTPAEVEAAGREFLRYVYLGGTLLGGTAEPTDAEKLQRLDANQDGLISQGEYADAGAAKYQKMDVDNNGELSFEEYWTGI